MKNLKLNTLAKDAMKEKEMSQIKGGSKVCHCGCNGPSSTEDNGWANSAQGLSSPGGGDIFITIETEVIVIATRP